MKKIIPLLVVGFLLLASAASFAQTISAGDFSSAAICSDNTVRTWGYNASGQLGNGTFISDSVPVQVNGLAGVIKITSGASHYLALKSDGTVWAWGDNSRGQLGDNTTTNRPSPININGLTGIVAIGCGQYHSFAVKNDGTLWAWGWNSNYMIGDSTNIDRHLPVQVHGITGVIAAAGGAFHSLALKIDGTVWAWGDNSYGQTGDNDTNTTEHLIPSQTSISDVKSIACSDYSCMALKNDSSLWGWGEGVTGELGDSIFMNYNPAYIPIPVTGISGVVGISMGSDHSLAFKSDGSGWGLGDGGLGQLGNGTTTNPVTIPTQMIAPVNIIAVAAANRGWHSIVLKSDGTLWGCGTNTDGELGNGTTSGNNPNPTPGQVISLCSVLIPPVNCTSNYALTPDTSQPHSYFIVSNPIGTPPFRHLWSWGDNSHDTLPYPSHTYADTGYYTICHSVFDATGCSSVFCNSSSLLIMPLQMVTVNVVSSLPTGIEVNKFLETFVLFPNPTRDELRIENAELRIGEIEIYNTLGEKCLTVSAGSTHRPVLSKGEGVRVDVSLLPAGVYFVAVTDDKGNKITRKFIKM